MMEFSRLQEQPHRRFNPLTRDWVLVSPHRTQRPWQGQTEENAITSVPYDPSCYLCPRNSRAGGHLNPDYKNTFVFDNDFAALKSDQPDFHIDDFAKGLLVAEAEQGICRVVCFSPRHDLTIPQMSVDDISGVIKVWTEQYKDLSGLPFINHVQIFENRGATMGCSNPHPHGQIWANSTVPNEPRKELLALVDYRYMHGSCLLCDYLKIERKDGQRIVCENEHFLALVPFWATWPFETLLLSKAHFGSFNDMPECQRRSLADVLKRLTTRYDNLFRISFPYSMGFHQPPTDGQAYPECHFHAHYYPPLLRSATVRKFMVGYEILATPQRDITPELAADRLREQSEHHYSFEKVG